MNNEYLELVKKAQEKRIKLTNDNIKLVKNLYSDIAKDLTKKIEKSSEKSLTERWLRDYRKQLNREIKELNKILERNLSESMLKSASLASNIQQDFFNEVSDKYKISFKDAFTNMFSKIPQNAANELISGNFYKDGLGLSERLWMYKGKANAQFDYIIEKGLLEKKNVYDLAKDLETFINPSKKQEWDFKKVYPSIGNKKIEYNSFRLAVTSVSHAYQLSMQRSCKANPFCDGIQWHTSNSHRGPCSLCLSREGKIYKSDELPLDHPLGVCYFIPIVEKSMDYIGKELNEWINGKENSKLDNWIVNNYKEEKIKVDDNSKILLKDNNKIDKEKSNFKDFVKSIFKKSNDISQKLYLSDIPKKDFDNISNIVNNAPIRLQEVFLQYSDTIMFLDINYSKTARYVPKENGIYINLKNDRENVHRKGAYTTLFHEIGHLIDKNMGRPSTNMELSESFKNAIIDDVNRFITDTKFNNNIEDLPKLINLINHELSEDERFHSISDIFGAVTQNVIVGRYRHDKDYWKRNGALERETFAHFFEATMRNDKYKLEIIQNTMHNAYNIFLDILMGRE